MSNFAAILQYNGPARKSKIVRTLDPPVVKTMNERKMTETLAKQRGLALATLVLIITASLW